LGYQWTFPGKKLLFMGGEFGQGKEWNANGDLDWSLLGQGPFHAGLQRFVRDLNQLYRDQVALWQGDYEAEGFSWMDCTDHERSVFSFMRKSTDLDNVLLVVLNLTPALHSNYRIGLPSGGRWREVLNSDSQLYGGSNQGNLGGVEAEAIRMHHQSHSACFVLPPLSVVVFAQS
jgi:1,4-alpha-glucan branching enzyme